VHTQPTLSPAEALERGGQYLRKQYPGLVENNVRVIAHELEIFQDGLVAGLPGTARLVYALEFANQDDLAEQLFIDAHTGQVVERFSRACTLLKRELYSRNLSNLIWSDPDPVPALLTASQQQQLTTTEATYNFFLHTFQWRSYDNEEGTMRVIDDVTNIGCPNARWNGYATQFCAGISTDDVVAHEWSHAYTDHTSELLYAWQAGAINEAYSDIWGETIDLLNDGPDANALRTDCDNSLRWKIAEDATALSGALRDMWNPNCYADPGKTSDSLYDCGSADFGGVHTNSGIVNHAYALLVDGGEYNGYRIAGIGLTKAAHLFWQAQAHYLSRTSDFAMLADALEAAYLDLRHVDLPALTLQDAPAGPAGAQLTATDSLAIVQVLAATELRLNAPPCPNFGYALQPHAPDFCPPAELAFTPFFTEDFEAGIGSWTAMEYIAHPDKWVSRRWMLTNQLPQGRAGTGMYAPNLPLGHCDTALNNGILRLLSPPIEVPSAVTGRIYLSFDHYFSLEKGRDGGNLKVQRNGGNWIKLPPSAFLFNSYPMALPMAGQTDNPLAGEWVFSGANPNSVSSTWGTTQIDLSVLGVDPGEVIRLRWEMGTDGCDGWDGWYLDNVAVGSCAAQAALPVSWLSFVAGAVPAGVQLTWSTATETDNAGFTVARSTDGRSFLPVGWVAGQTESSTPVHYGFLDTDLPTGNTQLYYRLRQEDHGGTFSYSAIRSVTWQAAASWKIFPNPVHDQLTLAYSGHQEREANITLLNLHGQAVLPPLSTALSNGTVTLSVSQLPAGVYLLQISGADFLETRRIVVE
jgi:bacillolysin